MSSFASKSSSSLSSQPDAEDVLQNYSAELMNDKPSIEVSIKNLIALVLGKSLSPTLNSSIFIEDNETSQSSSPTKKRKNIIKRLLALSSSQGFSPEEAIACAKLVIKAFNSFSNASIPSQSTQLPSLLHPPSAWGVEHPQEEDQTAANRIEQIAKYKVAYFLLNKISQSNQVPEAKAYKMFGRKFLQWTCIWPLISHKVMEIYNEQQQLNQSPSLSPTFIPEDSLALFLDIYGESINEKTIQTARSSNASTSANAYANANATDDGSNSNDEDDYELIWSQNFTKELAQRQEKRRQIVDQRVANRRIDEGEGGDVSEDIKDGKSGDSATVTTAAVSSIVIDTNSFVCSDDVCSGSSSSSSSSNYTDGK